MFKVVGNRVTVGGLDYAPSLYLSEADWSYRATHSEPLNGGFRYVPEPSEDQMYVIRDSADGTLVRTQDGSRTYEASKTCAEWVADILNRHAARTAQVV